MKMNELELAFDIYSENGIIKAIEAYKNYADISISRNPSSYKLTFTNCRYDVQLTIREFENYLICLENG